MGEPGEIARRKRGLQSDNALRWRGNVLPTQQYGDGLIGYFVGSNYDQLWVPSVPHSVPDPDYILPIGTGSSIMLPFDGTTAAFLTMLADPRALIHATTGILPQISIGIPAQFVGSAFARMEVTFTVGPILTDLVTAEIEDGTETTVLIPRPALKNGTWSWQEYDKAKWATTSVESPVPTARFSNVPPRLRNGLLRITGALGPPTKMHGPSF